MIAQDFLEDDISCSKSSILVMLCTLQRGGLFDSIPNSLGLAPENDEVSLYVGVPDTLCFGMDCRGTGACVIPRTALSSWGFNN